MRGILRGIIWKSGRRVVYTPAEQAAGVMLGWYDATAMGSITMDASNVVSAWNDLSGNGFHLANSGTGPTWNVGSATVPIGMVLNGNAMRGTFTYSSTTMTVLLVARMSSGASANGRLLTFSKTGEAFSTANGCAITMRDGSNENVRSFAATATQNILAITYDVHFIHTVTITTANLVSGINGAAETTATVTIGTTLNAIAVGAGAAAVTVDANFFRNRVSEILIFPTALATADKQVWQGYLAHKHGVSSVLDSTHPYKYTPP